ncbi:MAG: VWA domain-containing protein [Anaerolineae bacterium]|nr:VWA domain-containing protein [Anaerolineae bacterium]
MKANFVLDYNVIAVERAQHLYLLARIEAEPAPESERRIPLNLSVVLDRSGSMGGDKLDYVKQAAAFLIQHLGAADRVSLVSYSTNVTVNLPPTPVIEKDRIIQGIKTLRAGGMTNLSGGWLQGGQLVAEHVAERGVAERQINRVLLLTDGLANQGITDTVRLEAMARQKRAEGITTTTMGVGMDFNEDLLTRMAAEGGGAFYFIDNPDQAPHIFAEELRDLLSVVGQNLVITLTPSPDVDMVRQYNTYPTERSSGSAVFRLGDLFAEEQKTLLLELSIPALKDLGEVEVARLRFDYDEIGDDAVTHHTLELPINVNTVPADDVLDSGPNVEVIKTKLLLEAVRAREEAIDHADQGRFGDASQALSNAADAIHQSKIDDPELARQHDMLREEAVDMDLGAERYDSYSRKASITKSMYGARAARAEDTAMLHVRMKASRESIERQGETPTVITWKGGSLPLGEPIRIGRGDDNDIVVDEREVSKHHCEITPNGADMILVDCGSRNGTFANGGRLTGPFRLSVGDVVTVGTVLFMFE